ncbi:MAG: hypothetical protein Q8R02_08120 [Hyphomonadaceae bacterium]|nr:hypothetical protein [Hyphomonadaceae bacterium]
MDIMKWLARVAGSNDRSRPRARPPDTQHDRELAKRSLETRLPPHLLKDIGADDG